MAELALCPVLPGVALEAGEAWLPEADDVAPVFLADPAVWLDTWGVAPFGTPLHPASTAPAKTAPTSTDPCLLM